MKCCSVSKEAWPAGRRLLTQDLGRPIRNTQVLGPPILLPTMTGYPIEAVAVIRAKYLPNSSLIKSKNLSALVAI